MLAIAEASGEPGRIAPVVVRLLLSGLSEPVGGFPPPEHVRTALTSISELLGGEVLLDQTFREAAMRDRLSKAPFSVVHIATHGHFAADVDETFLLAYDHRLTVDELADDVGLFRFREAPLELLTLSACDTAQGDDRAGLGLSGVAIKAGARSALGTLWQVNDVATSELMVEFYRQLGNENVSRAAALQRAQLKLLGDLRYRHPGYWSPFLLISSWL